MSSAGPISFALFLHSEASPPLSPPLSELIPRVTLLFMKRLRSVRPIGDRCRGDSVALFGV